MCTRACHLKMSAPMKSIEILSDVSKDQFLSDVYPRRIPVVLRGLNIGECSKKWTVDYISAVGGCKEVKVHVSESCQMDFINKNFVYRTLPFSTLVRRASTDKQTEFFFNEDEKYYLRALGDDPRKDIADIDSQFPDLAKDIRFPDFFEKDQFFSSVFRIGSKGMQLWTHYDIMDNMLIQVTGRKKCVLFSPKDTLHMYLDGDKSQVLDIDNPDVIKYPDFLKAMRYECTLQAGDVLFIPALWFHNVTSLDFGIAVNVFWRHLDSKFYDNKDTYGNKDLSPATRAMQILDRALKAVEELPEEYRDFYARRLIARIQTKSLSNT